MSMNSKKEEIWDPFVKLFSKILELRMNKFLSLEGRVVLLNSVLNSISFKYLMEEQQCKDSIPIRKRQ